MKTIRRQGSTGFSLCWHRGGGYEAIMAAAALAMVSGAPFQERTDSGGQYWIKQSLDLDHSLVERCLSGDEAAWEGLVRTHTRWYALMEVVMDRNVETTANLRPRVFISHTSSDKSFVRRLAEELRTYNFRVWYDEWEVGIGDSIVEKVFEGLAASDALIVVL